MKQFFRIVRRVIVQTCVIYTLVSFLFTAIAASGNANLAPTVASLLQFLLLGFLCALSNQILQAEKIPLIARFFMHGAGILVDVFLSLFLIGGRTEQTTLMIGTAIAIVLGYLVFALIYATARRFAKPETPPQNYQKQFR